MLALCHFPAALQPLRDIGFDSVNVAIKGCLLQPIFCPIFFLASSVCEIYMTFAPEMIVYGTLPSMCENLA